MGSGPKVDAKELCMVPGHRPEIYMWKLVKFCTYSPDLEPGSANLDQTYWNPWCIMLRFGPLIVLETKTCKIIDVIKFWPLFYYPNWFKGPNSPFRSQSAGCPINSNQYVIKNQSISAQTKLWVEGLPRGVITPLGDICHLSLLGYKMWGCKKPFFVNQGYLLFVRATCFSG